MAENNVRPDSDRTTLTDDDPFRALAELGRRSEPDVASATQREPVAPRPVAAPMVEAEPTQSVAPAVAPQSVPDDLEAQLMAELGLVAASPVQAAAVAAPETDIVADVSVPTPAPAPTLSLEDELSALLSVEPAAPVTRAIPQPQSVPTPAEEPDVAPVMPELRDGHDFVGGSDAMPDVAHPVETNAPSLDDLASEPADDDLDFDFSDVTHDAVEDQTPEEPLAPIADPLPGIEDGDLIADDDALEDFNALFEKEMANDALFAEAAFDEDELAPTASIAMHDGSAVRDSVPSADDIFDEAFGDHGFEPEPTMEAPQVQRRDVVDDVMPAPQMQPEARREPVPAAAPPSSIDNALDDEFDALFAEDEPALPAAAIDAPKAETANDDPKPEPARGGKVGGLAALGAAFGFGKKPKAEQVEVEPEPEWKPEPVEGAPRNPRPDGSGSPLEELQAIMSDSDGSARASNAPVPNLETLEVEDFDSVFADFDVPDLPAESEPRREAVADIHDFGQDFDEPAAVSTASIGSVGQDFDSMFKSDEFEAELAKDIEFAAHDARNAVPVSNAVFDDDELASPFDGDDQEPEADTGKRGKRGFVVAAVIGAIALAGAVGVFAMNSGSTQVAGPVVISPEPGPVKVQPENPGGSAVPNQDSAVFTDNAANPAASQQELVTTSEEPVDIATSPGAALPLAVGEKIDDRVPADDPETGVAANDGSATTVTPRRVRTLVVRPDGTLVEQEVPAPTPVNPDVTIVANAPTPETSVESEVVSATTNAAQDAPTPTDVPVIRPQADAEAASAPRIEAEPRIVSPQVPVRTVTTQPIIADRPANQPVNVVNPQPSTQVAAAPQAAAPAAPAAAPSGEAPFVIQIASVPSREGAQQQATNLQRQYANVLGGRGVSIQRAEIDGRGTFYRVRVAASSRNDATQLCEQYKRAGGSCFVSR